MIRVPMLGVDRKLLGVSVEIHVSELVVCWQMHFY